MSPHQKMNSKISAFRFREFTKTAYCDFFRELFLGTLDVLVVFDCLNRYNLLCHPDKKEKYLNKKVGAVEMLLIFIVSVVFSGLVAVMRHEEDLVLLNTAFDDFHNRIGFGWMSYVGLKLFVSVLICIFHVVVTARTRRRLERAIAFLLRANVDISHGHVRKYEKLRKFSLVVCLLIVINNFVVRALEISIKAHRNRYLHARPAQKLWLSRSDSMFLNIARYVINVVVCIKPCCYAAAYSWLKMNTHRL